MLVDALAELELTNATTIDGNNVSAATFTVHGELESVAGVNTIKNFSGTHFTSDGTIEVVGSATGSGDVVAGDADSDATSNTLVLDNDYLTSTGTVLVDALAELELTNATTIDARRRHLHQARRARIRRRRQHHQELQRPISPATALIEVVGSAGSAVADADAANTLVLDNDTLDQHRHRAGRRLGRLELTNATTIDSTGGGTITKHGEIESVVGVNTISNAGQFHQRRHHRGGRQRPAAESPTPTPPTPWCSTTTR